MNESTPADTPPGGIADRVVDSWSRLGQRIRASQVRSEIRRLEQRAARLRTELARHLLGSADLPAHIPLTPRLSAARDELRRTAGEAEEVGAARDAEREREHHLEEEKSRGLEPMRAEIEGTERQREEARRREERSAREGLSIARKREALDRELQAIAEGGEGEFPQLRRRHAVEELEAIERRAAQLTAEREDLAREVSILERRLAASRQDFAGRAEEWDAPLAECRARRLDAEGRAAALERRQRRVFDDVASEATVWAESWRKVAPTGDDLAVRRAMTELDEIAAEREALVSRLGAPQGRTDAVVEPGGDPGARIFLWVALAGFGMLFSMTAIVIVIAWFWMRDDTPMPRWSTPARGDQSVAAAAPQAGLADLERELASRGVMLKSEAIPSAPVGALEGRRFYPFADEPGAVEVWCFASELQAKEVRRRMGRLVPDPLDTLFAENGDQAGRFVIWGLSQFPAKSRRTLKAAFHAAAVR